MLLGEVNSDPFHIKGVRAFAAARSELEQAWQAMKINMQYGMVTINEARDAQGLPPMPWGYKP